MERLTYDFCIGGNHCWQVKGADNLECREVCERQGDDGCKTCPIAKAFDRLAAYEDTGLEPEEIELLAKQRDLYVDVCGELPLKRIRELAQADREGRCVVLPCKIGDPVWRLYDDCDFPGDCYTKQKCRGCEYRNLFIEEQAFCLSMLCQNGKLAPPYYTIRADAEDALRRE